MHLLYLHKYSFKLSSYVLFNYIFQNSLVALIPKSTGNGYVIFGKIVCNY
jgi:hypothetical protein